MSLQILHSPTAAAVAAALDQTTQRAQLLLQFGSANVTVRSFNGATLRDTVTYGPWQLDSNTPRGATLGTLLARTVTSTGVPTSFVFRAGGTDIFSLTAAVSPGLGDVVLPTASGGISAVSRTNLSDDVAGKVTIAANPALPVLVSTATSFSLFVSPSSGLNGVDATVTVTPNGPIPSGGVSVSLAATNGGVIASPSLSFTSGATAAQSTTLSRSAAGSSMVFMTNTGSLTNGSPQSYTSSAPGSATADWVARSTASGVTHAENWSSFNTAAEAYSSPRTAGMNKNPSNPTTFDNAFQIVTDAGHVLSGKAMRLWHGKNNYGGAGTIDNQYMSIPFNGNRNAVNGQYPTGAYLTKAYVQMCFWTDAFLDYYWKLGDGSVGGSKIFIIDNWDQTATTGELVITDRLNRNFISAYRITTGGGSAGLERSISTPANSSNFLWQNAVDNGGVLTDQNSYERRYGPMYAGMTGGTSQASLLSTQGVPDPDAAIGGVAFNKGGITVVEVELDLANDRCRVWAAHHGQAPKLIGDTLLDNNSGGLALFGSRVRPGLGTGWSGLYLSNLIYTASGAQNPAYPTDAYTDYAELIVSQNPINFPGGFVPPGTLPSWVGAVGTAVALPTSTLSTSGAPWTGGGGITDYQKVMGAWGGGCLNTKGIWRAGAYVSGTFLVIFGGGHGDYAGNELYAYGPIGSNAPTWSRIIDPTVPPPVDVARLGGYPVSRHTYDSLVYLPDQNRMLCIGAAGYHNAGFAFNTGDVFDFSINPASANPWTTADTSFPAYNGGGVGTISIVTGYNRTTGKAWGLGYGNAQKLGSYTASTGTWASTDCDRPLGPTSGAADIWHTQNIMVFVSGQTAYGVNLALATPTVVTLATSGTLPPSSGSWVANWDTTGNRFVFADASTGLTLYYLTPPGSNFMAGTWAWSSQTFTGTAPAGLTGNGIYGRAQMVDTIGGRGLLIAPGPTNPAIFYRMS